MIINCNTLGGLKSAGLKLLVIVIAFFTVRCNTTVKHKENTSSINKKPAFYLSIFHPIVPDTSEMKRYIELTKNYIIDGFEVCGDAHGWRQGLDGVLLFEKYPQIMKIRDKNEILSLRKKLNKIVSLAHANNKKIIYWHREVIVLKEFMDVLPEVFDENKEIDYNKEIYFDLLKYKIDEFFKVVPDMDGIVLTLTEADYAVIHNSDTKRYPPEKVAARIIETFAGELKKRGKTFSLRTFGSIEADHKILAAAAEMASAQFSYEVHAKITPFDWSLYAGINPYLKRFKNTTLAAEFDVNGEFFGLGELPCLYPDRILNQIKHTDSLACDRLALRCDRDNRYIFDSPNEMNLFAIYKAWQNPNISEDEIWSEWAKQNWGDAASELIPIMKRSEEMIKKAYYIDHQMFSQAPTPEWQYVALGATFSLFNENISLDFAKDMWSIFPERKTPTREFIIKEKEEAVNIAAQSYKKLLSIQNKIPLPQRDKILQAWEKATWVTRMQLATAKIIIAYFNDMQSNEATPNLLKKEIDNSMNLCQDASKLFKTGLVTDFIQTLDENGKHFLEHYKAEYKAKKKLEELKNVNDLIVCGGFTFEHRVRRYMHASKIGLLDGYPYRSVGSKVFPDGFLEYKLKIDPKRKNEVLIKYFDQGATIKLIVDSDTTIIKSTNSNKLLTKTIPIHSNRDTVTVKIEKMGDKYPLVSGLVSKSID